jgi:hypothetical protein
MVVTWLSSGMFDTLMIDLPTQVLGSFMLGALMLCLYACMFAIVVMLRAAISVMVFAPLSITPRVGTARAAVIAATRMVTTVAAPTMATTIAMATAITTMPTSASPAATATVFGIRTGNPGHTDGRERSRGKHQGTYGRDKKALLDQHEMTPIEQ